MNVTVNATGAWQRTIDIEVPSEEVERRLDEVARTIQRRASLPGFRRGRVPLALVRQHFAEAVEREFLEGFVPRATGEALGETRLDPVVPPLVRNLRFTPGQPMRFQAVVDVRPEVEVRDFRGLPAVRRVRAIDEGEVDSVLERLREEAAVFVELDRPAQRGDVLTVDSVRLDVNGRRIPSTRGRNLPLELGAPDMLPDLENGLLGAQVGQERTVEIAYPADHPTRELAGRRVRYLVRVKRIQEKKLRDLDDNFAREVFELPGLEELRGRVRRNLEAEAGEWARRQVEDAVVDELIRRNPFELPERLMRWTLDRMIQEAAGRRSIEEGVLKDLEQRYRPAVERSLRREILLGAVARQEGLQVTAEDLAAEIERMTQGEPRQAARIRARYQSAERRQALSDALLERRALDLLVTSAQVQENVVGGRIVPAAS
jgi:trigger factor